MSFSMFFMLNNWYFYLRSFGNKNRTISETYIYLLAIDWCNVCSNRFCADHQDCPVVNFIKEINEKCTKNLGCLSNRWKYTFITNQTSFFEPVALRWDWHLIITKAIFRDVNIPLGSVLVLDPVHDSANAKRNNLEPEWGRSR